MSKLHRLLDRYEDNAEQAELELIQEVPLIYKELIQLGMLPDEIADSEKLARALIVDYGYEFVSALTMENLIDDLFVLAVVDSAIDGEEEPKIPECKYIGTQTVINFDNSEKETSVITVIFDSLREVQEIVDIEGTLSGVAGNILCERTSVGNIPVMAREDILDAIHEIFPNSDGDVLIDNIPEDCTAATILLTVSKEKEPYPIHEADIIALYEATV